MQSLRTLPHHCRVLALAVLQFWMLVSAEAHMAQQGVDGSQICRSLSTKASLAELDGGADQFLAGHYDCSGCCFSMAPPTPALGIWLSHAQPTGQVRVGHTWYAPGSPSGIPPSTGPPRVA